MHNDDNNNIIPPLTYHDLNAILDGAGDPSPILDDHDINQAIERLEHSQPELFSVPLIHRDFSFSTYFPREMNFVQNNIRRSICFGYLREYYRHVGTLSILTHDGAHALGMATLGLSLATIASNSGLRDSGSTCKNWTALASGAIAAARYLHQLTTSDPPPCSHLNNDLVHAVREAVSADRFRIRVVGYTPYSTLEVPVGWPVSDASLLRPHTMTVSEVFCAAHTDMATDSPSSIHGPQAVLDSLIKRRR